MGEGADSEKMWGEGRRIIWGEGEGRERREDKGREIDGVRVRIRQRGQKKKRKGRKRGQWLKREEKRERWVREWRGGSLGAGSILSSGANP